MLIIKKVCDIKGVKTKNTKIDEKTKTPISIKSEKVHCLFSFPKDLNNEHVLFLSFIESIIEIASNIKINSDKEISNVSINSTPETKLSTCKFISSSLK